MLMDLHNNAVGRNLALNPPSPFGRKCTNADDLFTLYAPSNLILNVNNVYNYFGITSYADIYDWTVNVIWYLNQDIIWAFNQTWTEYKVITLGYKQTQQQIKKLK